MATGHMEMPKKPQGNWSTSCFFYMIQKIMDRLRFIYLVLEWTTRHLDECCISESSQRRNFSIWPQNQEVRREEKNLLFEHYIICRWVHTQIYATQWIRKCCFSSAFFNPGWKISIFQQNCFYHQAKYQTIGLGPSYLHIIKWLLLPRNIIVVLILSFYH